MPNCNAGPAVQLRIATGALLLMAASAATLHADDPAAGSDRLLLSNSLLVGCGRASLNRQDDYRVAPLILRFALDPRPAAAKIGIELSDNWSFNLEPYFAQVTSPADRQELGCGLMLRWSPRLWSTPLRAFLEGGVAPVWMTTETREQSTDFNFLDQAGIGLIYDPGHAWTAEIGVRIWHISNAGIDHPNSGIEGGTVILGLTRAW